MIKLVPMTEEDFLDYRKEAIPNYAADKCRANGYPKDGALRLANETFEKLLPKGIETPNHYLFNLESEAGDILGILWIGIAKEHDLKLPYVFDVQLEPQFRGKGYGKAAMAAAEAKVRELGYNRIGLHVFAHNEIAVGLYQRLGYRTTDFTMQKELGSSSDGFSSKE